MHRININSAPIVFIDKLTNPSHLYPTRLSHLNYAKLTHKLNRCKYRVSIRKPDICDSNGIGTHNRLVHKQTLKPFSQTGQMIGLCCEYLSARCI